MEINGRKQEPVRLGTHGENYGNWMSAPVFYMVGALVVLMAALCVISHFIPGMRLLGVLALIAAAAVLPQSYCLYCFSGSPGSGGSMPLAGAA